MPNNLHEEYVRRRQFLSKWMTEHDRFTEEDAVGALITKFGAVRIDVHTTIREHLDDFVQEGLLRYRVGVYHHPERADLH